jgi:small-conductance mechanosensitive channel
MAVMEQIEQILNYTIINIADHQITVGQVVIIPTFLVVAYFLLAWAVSMTTALLSRRQVNPDVVQIVRRAVFILGLIIIFITTLDLLSVPLAAFAFVSGAIAIGVGFGAQNIINNFISGWILMWERPIRINDYIEVDDTMGTVESIDTRSTRIRRVDGVHMLVPNSKLLEQTVVNWTLVDKLLRSIVRVGVAYGSDVQLVKQVLEQIAINHPLILEDPLPEVVFEDFGDSALVFDLYFWVQSGGDKSARAIRSEVRFEVDRLFSENGVTIAFPQQDVHLDGEIRMLSS